MGRVRGRSPATRKILQSVKPYGPARSATAHAYVAEDGWRETLVAVKFSEWPNRGPAAVPAFRVSSRSWRGFIRTAKRPALLLPPFAVPKSFPEPR
jgi:hypothetical protein